MEKVAIIGMGIAGTGVLSAYEKELKDSDIVIDCYDSKKSFGKGYPFRNDSDEILINVKRDSISYDYENMDDFHNWIEENKITDEDYVPRNLFGKYTSIRLEESLNNFGANVFYEEVLDLTFIENDNKWELETTSGKKLYDRVHLCAGELPNMDFYNLENTKNYIDEIYPAKEKLKDIKEDDVVCIIGTSLSAVDIGRYLIREINPKKIYMFSRGNFIPTMRMDAIKVKRENLTLKNLKDRSEKNNDHISFEDFDNLIEADAKNLKINFEFLLKKYVNGLEGMKLSLEKNEELIVAQSYLADTTDEFNYAWLKFNKTDKEKYKEKYENIIQVFAGPLPPPTGEILVDAGESGVLEFLEDIEDVKYSENEERFYLLSEENDMRSVKKKVDWVLNATGQDLSMKSLDLDKSFLGKLINKRYVQIDDYGGFTVMPNTLVSISPKYGEMRSFHIHGVLISGVILRNNSARVIKQTAHNIIKSIYK